MSKKKSDHIGNGQEALVRKEEYIIRRDRCGEVVLMCNLQLLKRVYESLEVQRKLHK